jgi:hypothetical protein
VRITHAIALLVTVTACGRYGDYDVNVRTSATTDNGDSDQGLGTQWEALGASLTGNGITNHSADAACAHVVATSSGAVYVLWADAVSGNGQTYLRAFTDSWRSVAGSADGGGMSQGNGVATDGTHLTCPGGLAVDASDNLYATWQEYDGARQSIDLRMWNGATWSGLGGSDAGDGVNGGNFGWWPTVIIDGAGRPVIAYEQGANPYVVRWENPWTGVGGADSGTGLASADGISFIPTLAPGTGTDVFAIWGEYTATTDDNLIRGARWSQATGWVNLGDVVGHLTSVNMPPGLLTYNGAPLVFWADSDQVTAGLHMQTWTGTTWQSMTPPVATGTGCAMRVDHNGHLVAAWTQQDGALPQVHAAWYDGASWQSLDPVEGSISQSSRAAGGADLAVDGAGRLIIIWRQSNDAGIQVLYGRRTVAPL